MATLALVNFQPAMPYNLLGPTNGGNRCVSSCTAHIEELCDPKDRISDFGAEWRQFRLVVGAPDAEAKFDYWKKKAAEQSTNATNYPTLFAFHGSPTQNWHSVR